MKPSQVLAVPVILGIGFLVGRLTTEPMSGVEKGADRSDGGATVRTRSSERPASSGRASSPEYRLRTEIQSAPSGLVPKMVFRALETGDPVLRAQLMGELLGKMNAGNFQEMLAEVERVSNDTGREHTDDWLLMITRAGQVAGPEAVEMWKQKGFASKEAAAAFYGWANTNPAEARQWLDSRQDLTGRENVRLLDSLLSGAVVHDPNEAIDLFASLPEESRNNCLHGFSNSLVDNIGKDGAVDWLKSIQAAEPGSEFGKKVTTRVFDRILWSGANRLNASSMVSDLERLSSVMPIDENWIVRGMGQIRDRKATGGIELMDRIYQSPMLKDLPFTDSAWTASVDFALQRDREAVAAWLAANPDSPIHEKVAERYSR